jgi:uncharacterized UBP type Zn finger protein
MDLLRTLTGTSEATCPHRPAELATPSGTACEGCGSTRSLRMCASCGHVGCCDSQAGHARRHYDQSGHEVMVAMPVGHGFTWCYEDKRYLD